MEKANNLGEVQIADDVIAMIAALAATEVDGVDSMAGDIPHELIAKIGYKKLSRGVKVELLDGDVNVDVALNLAYGYNIPEASKSVQAKVKEAIENMTGLHVEEVNVRIAGVNMNNDKGE